MTEPSDLTKQDKIKNFNDTIRKQAAKKVPAKASGTPVKENNLTEVEQLKAEIERLKSENFNIKTLSALDKAGCIKSELVMKVIPKDCENLQDWIDSFKTENEILFKQPPRNHGGNFKPSNCSNLSPSELMNNYIRGL